MRSIHATILGAALLGTASLATAQAPSNIAGKLPKQHFTRSQSFDLPIVMEQDYRVTLSEIRLYVRTPTTPWKLQESVAPHSTRFNCKVTQDGEYWYTLATVDKAGRMTPPDVGLEPPSQRVMVDTMPPAIQANPATGTDGDVCLRCTVADANIDPASLKARCKTEFGEIPLEEIAGQQGVFRIKGAEALRFPVTVTAKDLAGNVTTKEVSLRDLLGTAKANTNTNTKMPPNITQTAVTPDSKDPPLPSSRFDVPPQLPPVPPLKNENPPHRVELPAPDKTQVVPIQNPLPPVDPPLLKVPTIPDTPKAGSAPTQLINTTRASVEYRIDDVGPSGVGKVEIFMSPDNGQTWHSLGENPDKKSPAKINLPGDGLYGIRIAVSNGNGFGGRRPVRGDAPHCCIEVDTTSPYVQLRSEKVLASAGHVELRWNAQDANLGVEPVSLFYRTKADGAWQPIIRNIKNDGAYNWNFPREVGGQFFFKIEVADKAGNVSHDTSRQPVVIDVSEPRATVVGVSGGSAQK
jgi:hypothetical protein